MRWRVAKPSRAGPAEYSETTVQRQIETAVVQYFHVMDLAQGYRGHFLKDSQGNAMLGPDGKALRVDETTHQTRGLPDLYLIPRNAALLDCGCVLGGCWLEIKRPRVEFGGHLVQDRGKRNWYQEQFHRNLRAVDGLIATVESVNMALSYLAHVGYALPHENLDGWDDTCQGWYYDHTAKPATRSQKMTRKIPRRTVGGWHR